MLNTDKELKLYYSIGEVADMFGVNQSLLRFWEKEPSMVTPTPLPWDSPHVMIRKMVP